MKRSIVLTGIAAAVVAFTTFRTPATAGDFGLHFAGSGYHIDVGRAHYGNHYGGYRTVRYGLYGDGCYGGGHVWHDTSHYDYHPSEFVRHRNHYHFVPGHWDYHDTGHWDHYGW
jgi:hypothetical protein